MRIFLQYVFVLVSLAAIPRPAGARELIHRGETVVVPLRGEISPPLLLFLRREADLPVVGDPAINPPLF